MTTRPQITVLGAWGLASTGETPSFLIEGDGAAVLLDMCPGVTRQLKRRSFDTTRLDIAFGSHIHADHLLGSTYLVFQNSVEQRTADPNSTRELEFLGAQSVIEAVQASLRLHYPERKFPLRARVVTPDDGPLTHRCGVVLSFAWSDHTAECLAVRVEFPGSKKSVVYTADGLFTDAVRHLAEGCDVLIGEAFGTMSDYKDVFTKVKHSLGVHVGELAQHARVGALLPFHMHPRYDIEERKRNELLDEIRARYTGAILWPSDLATVLV